jgi:hypothetical protein
MDNKTSNQFVRRYNNYTGTLNSNTIHLRNPWMTAWWSAALPGFGHLSLGIYVKGFIFIFWEVLINVHSRINEAMVYSFIGQFDMAKEVINLKLFFLYLPVYIITIWDSQRQTIDLNKHYLLAESENAPIVPFNMNGYALNYLDKRNPWVAFVASLLFPGLGHLYIHRIPTGFIIMAFSITIIFMSNLLLSIHFTLHVFFHEAIAILDPQWALFFPSIYCFSAYDAYSVGVEYNNIYKKEQRQYLQKNYQHSNYQLL